MADEAFFLTRQDVADFRLLIQEYRTKQRGRTSLRDYDAQDFLAPEVYIARTPTGGISALDMNGTGTGTVNIEDDSPGAAECKIYRFDESYGTGTGTASDDHIRDTGNTKIVYNLSDQHIPEKTWILAVRDKFGKWFHVETGPSAGSGGDGDQVDWITILSNTPSGVYYPGIKVVITPPDDTADPVLVKKVEGECFLPNRNYLGKYEETVSDPTTGTGADIDVYSCSGNDKHCVVYCAPDGSIKRDMWFLPAPFDLNVDIGNDCGTGSGTSP